jgi:uncharacterized protein
MGQVNHEPSMEDILASIKRIIAEDSEAAGVRPPRSRREPPPVLGDRGDAKPAFENVPSVDPVDEAARAPEPVVAPPVDEEPEEEVQVVAAEASQESGDVLELTSPIAQAEAEESETVTPSIPNPVHAFDSDEAAQPASAVAEVPPTTVANPTEALLSDTTRAASRSAFAALNQLQVRSEAGQSNTLEGLVADLLKPMLSEWLDRELPALVERLVSAEIARVSGRG